MEKFTKLTGVAAPMGVINIDTDMIIPKQYLKTIKRSGLGKALLKDALLRMERAAEVLAIRAVLVHAIDEQARGFYSRFGFEPCPEDDLYLMLPMKDIRKQLRR